ncbi:MAG: hypothetical protein WCT25_00085 [Candidatus Paceibacterota bacterium]
MEEAKNLLPEAPVAPELSVATVEQGAQAANWELMEPGGKGFETLTKPEKLNVLIRVEGENSLALTQIEASANQERAKLIEIREGLGMAPLAEGTLLSPEIRLQELREERERLEQARLELLQEEMRQIWQEQITATFEIFKKMPPEQFKTVLETGEIPSLYEQLLKLLSTIFGQGEKAPKMEAEYVIVLAEAYENGYTTIDQISAGVPKFAELQTEMQPMIAEVATERLLKGPEQNLIEDKEAVPELTNNEPAQIPETSSGEAAPEVSSSGAEVVTK